MLKYLGAALIGAVACLAGPAAAQPASSQFPAVVLLKVIAERGADCGLLRPWEAAIIDALADQESLGWAEMRRAEVETETRSMAAGTACDAPVLITWIEGARRGIRTEYLSLYLVVYDALQTMDEPPAIFGELARRDRPSEDGATIRAAIEAMAASGAAPDGGGPWPDFVARTQRAVLEFAPLLDTDEAPAEVRFLIPRAIAISELWLAEQDERATVP